MYLNSLALLVVIPSIILFWLAFAVLVYLIVGFFVDEYYKRK